jgi:hypothetical protein
MSEGDRAADKIRKEFREKAEGETRKLDPEAEREQREREGGPERTQDVREELREQAKHRGKT